MTMSRRSGTRILLGIFLLACGVFIPAFRTASGPLEDSAQTVEVFAAAGVLSFHGRAETQYRALNAGTHSLASGSYLKTGNGSAELLLPDNSVLSLDANTEVRLGMYGDGTLVAQKSGRAWHAVEWQDGRNYGVDLPYGRAKVTGTEFYTFVDWPIRGLVSVVVGHVDFETLVTERDPRTGEVLNQWWQKNLIPEGNRFMAYLREPTQRLKEGDAYLFTYEQVLRYPSPAEGRKVAPPADDSWIRRNRNLGRMIQDIRRRRGVGRLTPEEYRRKLGSLLGISPAIIPGRPLTRLGGLWMGGGDYFIIKMCITGNTISQVHIVDEWQGRDKETGENYQQRVNFSFPRGEHFSIGEGGLVNDGATIEEGIWKGASLVMSGHIGESTGRLFINIYSETDVATYLGWCGEIRIRLIDPNGCNY